LPVPAHRAAAQELGVKLRSWLFVPGDAASKMEKAVGAGADVAILDLEDSIAETRKPEARRLVADFLAARPMPRAPSLFVRINPLSSLHALADLAAVVPAGPDGIVLPKPDSADDAVRLDHYLAAFEASARLPAGRIRVLPIATETPRALFTLDTYRKASGRLVGLTWGAEDLPVAVGASTNRGADGGYSDLGRRARTRCLAGASAVGLPPIDTVYPDFRDVTGLEACAARSRRDGFVGMMAIHPRQVPVINAVFAPTAQELDHARQVIALFEADPGVGAVSLDGRMLDLPHLKQARALLARGAADDGVGPARTP